MISEEESERKISCSHVATGHDRFNDPIILQAKKPFMRCDHCQCWKLIDYLDDYKFKGKYGGGNSNYNGRKYINQSTPPPQFFANGKNGGQFFASANNVSWAGVSTGGNSHDNHTTGTQSQEDKKGH